MLEQVHVCISMLMYNIQIHMYVCLGLVQVSPKVGVVGVRRRTRKKPIFWSLPLSGGQFFGNQKIHGRQGWSKWSLCYPELRLCRDVSTIRVLNQITQPPPPLPKKKNYIFDDIILPLYLDTALQFGLDGFDGLQ